MVCFCSFDQFFGDLSPTIPSFATMNLGGGASPFVRFLNSLLTKLNLGSRKTPSRDESG